MTESHERPDYVWHFKLSKDTDETQDPEALTAIVREQVRALLRCVTLTNDGADLKVTGFRFLDEPDREHIIRPTLPIRPSAQGESEAEPDGEAVRPLPGGELR